MPSERNLRKGKKFEWKPEHTKAMKKLKKTVRRAEALKKPNYDRPIIVTVDTSPTGIGWVINQADSEGSRYPIRFGAKVLNERQRGYAQVKRELWGVVSAIKADRDYLIGAMLRWIAYVKSLNPEVRHISGKDNAVADMLSRARFGGHNRIR